MTSHRTEDSYVLTDAQYTFPDESVHGQALPPVDGGKGAWMALAGCFVLEALVWGFPFSYGIFQTYYSMQDPFSGDPASIAAISTTATAIMYLSSPLMALAMQRYPSMRLPGGLFGLVVMVVALVVASFCNSAVALLGTQGVLFAVGGLFLYFPSMYVIDEWFVARKALAFGVVWTGTGCAAAIIHWLMQWLLRDYGFRTALRVWAIILVIFALPAILAVRNRLPISRSRIVRKVDFSFVRHAPFWFYQTGNTIQATASFLPQLWIPSFAREIGLPSYSGALAICLLNIAACGGYLLQGQLCDRFHVTVALLVATLGSMLSIFLLWGFTANEPMLYLFSIAWGLTGAGFAATWAGCANAMRTSTNNLDTGMVISLMCVGKGIGSVVSGPISERLLQAGPLRHAGFAYGTPYGSVILFTGLSAMLGGTACVGRLLKWV